MSTFTVVVVIAIISAALGYWIGFSRAAHPGKVAGEASSLWAKIKAALHL